MISGEIQSPMGIASVEFVNPREPVAVSILIIRGFHKCHRIYIYLKLLNSVGVILQNLLYCGSYISSPGLAYFF